MNDIIQTVMLGITTFASLFSAVTALVSAVRKKKGEKLQDQLARANKESLCARRELLKLYQDVDGLLKVEAALSAQVGKGKASVRKEVSLDELVQPKRVASRIKELTDELAMR